MGAASDQSTLSAGSGSTRMEISRGGHSTRVPSREPGLPGQPGQCSFQNVIRQHWKDLIWGFLMATWPGLLWDTENSASSKHSVYSIQPLPIDLVNLANKNVPPISNLVKSLRTTHFSYDNSSIS